jgi:Alkylmercury lyase
MPLESGVTTDCTLISTGKGGRILANLVIKTADELGDNDVEARAGARRSARETPVLRAVLRLFADSGGPVSVAVVAESLAGAEPEVVAKTLATLSDDDLLILRGDRIELAYPFSTSSTPFVVRRADGRERFTCCALDALGIAPMLNEDVEITTRCHHCSTPLRFTVGPEGPSPDAHDLMVWVTRLRPDDGRACAVL